MDTVKQGGYSVATFGEGGFVAKKKDKTWRVRVEDDLDQNAAQYAKDKGVSLGALIRAIMRVWVDPQDPRELPPGIEAEAKRPSRQKKPKK